jgi:hypothetical protein
VLTVLALQALAVFMARHLVMNPVAVVVVLMEIMALFQTLAVLMALRLKVAVWLEQGRLFLVARIPVGCA